MNRIWHYVTIPLIAALLLWRISGAFQSSSDSTYPTQPVHVVVPYGAGGGTDNFVRLFTKTIAERELLPQPLVVINQSGGSGTIGSRYVKDARPDGYRILCHHESIITAKLSGSVPFGPEAFEPILQTGGINLLVVVREDAPYQSMRDLLEAAKKEPKKLRFGANIGSPAHFTAMKLEAAYPGAQFNLITAGGGQKRFVSILGGHLEAGIFSLAEYLAFRAEEGTPPDKNIRALAVLSSERIPALPQIGNCLEEGLDVTSDNAYYWWAPKGTPPAITETLSQALLAAWEQKEVRETLDEWSIAPEITKGETLLQRLQDRVSKMEKFAVRAEPDLPNFPLYAILIALALVVVVVIKSRVDKSVPTAAATQQYRPTILTFGIIIAYVLLLQLRLVPFAIATIAMVFLCGAVISSWERRRWLVMAEIALIAGLGSEFVFTRIFTVALP
ncbi:tripartite tricarboxylate transporter substrate-binding protein [Verrucomicrobia bacterium]|nr:tripartite tricarboxylate transporter substrate-binding protein [Verrucomicrobiota bacterium]MDG1891013.1 tripartite tricarboxylate transporter substrate-binding protein [Verrucomicrobiota bacterium]